MQIGISLRLEQGFVICLVYCLFDFLSMGTLADGPFGGPELGQLVVCLKYGQRFKLIIKIKLNMLFMESYLCYCSVRLGVMSVGVLSIVSAAFPTSP